MASLSVSPAQLRALRWLRDHGGCASIDRWGRLRTSDGSYSGSTPATFLRLVVKGLCARHLLDGHLGITLAGIEAAR